MVPAASSNQWCSAAGSGTLFENEWLAKANLTRLPEVMVLYREQLRTAAKRDTEARPEVAKILEQQGLKETDVQNKTHYICNSEIERCESDAALGRRQKMTETVAMESDGHPCRVAKPEDIEKILKVMNDGVEERKQFVHKPYRTKEQIVADLQLKFPEIPPEYFAEVDLNWRRKAELTLEFKRRMMNGENPVLISKILVPEFLYKGRQVRDQLRTVSGSKDSLDYVMFTQKLHGGSWKVVHRKIGDAFLKEICKDFCLQVEGSKPGWGRARVMDGTLPSKMVLDIAAELYDPKLLVNLNGDDTWKFIQFECGRVLDTTDMTVHPGPTRVSNYRSILHHFCTTLTPF